MLFSYYFNTDKTHLLNCQYKTLQHIEKGLGVIEILFSAEISEWQNGVRKRRETTTATFTFPAVEAGQQKHDIDFTRVRFSDEKKWIFTIINNKDTSQRAVIGLISTTANKNPLGMDIYSDETEFNMELKANNLSILESSFVSPVLTQTMANSRFDQGGYPQRFDSATASYEPTYQNYKLSDFTQGFLEAIPFNTFFRIQMDIAPYEVTPVSGTKVFELNIPNLGCVALLKNGLEFMVHNGNTPDVKRLFFGQEIKPSDFWSSGMLTKARLTIEGNGNGLLTIKYYDQVLQGSYDPTLQIDKMEFKGALKAVAMFAMEEPPVEELPVEPPVEEPPVEEPVEEMPTSTNPANWIGIRLDNIAVIYQK